MIYGPFFRDWPSIAYATISRGLGPVLDLIQLSYLGPNLLDCRLSLFFFGFQLVSVLFSARTDFVLFFCLFFFCFFDELDLRVLSPSALNRLLKQAAGVGSELFRRTFAVPFRCHRLQRTGENRRGEKETKTKQNFRKKKAEREK